MHLKNLRTTKFLDAYLERLSFFDDFHAFQMFRLKKFSSDLHEWDLKMWKKNLLTRVRLRCVKFVLKSLLFGLWNENIKWKNETKMKFLSVRKSKTKLQKNESVFLFLIA